MALEQGERLGGEPAAVPAVRQPARHAADLRAADARGRCGGTPRRARPGRRRRCRRPGRRPCPAAAGSAAPSPAPSPLRGTGRRRRRRGRPGPCRHRALSSRARLRGVVDGREAEGPGGGATLGGRIDDDDLRGTVDLCQQPHQQADRPASRHEHEPAVDPVPQLAAPGVRGGVQQAVHADGPEVGHVDAEQRVEPGRQRHDVLGHGVAVHGGRVPVGHGHHRALGHRGGAAVGDLGDLHVTQALHRELRRGPVAVEHAELGVPAAAEVGAGAAVPGELGAGRQSGEQRPCTEPTIGERRQRGLHDRPAPRPGARRGCATGRAAVIRSPPAPARPSGRPRRRPRPAGASAAPRPRRPARADACRPESTSTKARSTAVRAFDGRLGAHLAVPGAHPQAVSVSSSATPSATTSSPAAVRAGSTQDVLTVPTAPDPKRSTAAVASGTSRPSAVDGAAAADHLGHLAGQHPDQVEHVGGLLDDLAAGPVLPAPPGRRRRGAPPAGVDQPDARCRPGPSGPGRRCPGAASGSRSPSAARRRRRRRRRSRRRARSAASGFSTKNGSPARTTASSSSPCANGGTHSQTASSPSRSRPVRSSDAPGRRAPRPAPRRRRRRVADRRRARRRRSRPVCGRAGHRRRRPPPAPPGRSRRWVRSPRDAARPTRSARGSSCGRAPPRRSLAPAPWPGAETRPAPGGGRRHRLDGKDRACARMSPVARPPDLPRHRLRRARSGGRQAERRIRRSASCSPR